MGRAAANQRAAVLREATCKRGVDVLVRQIGGRRAPGSGPEPATEACEHDPAEPEPCGDRRDPRKGAGHSCFVIRRRNCDVDCHELPIRRLQASRERVMPVAWLRAFGCPGGRHEELAMRALEPAVTLGLAGDQFGRERLLAMRAPDLVQRILSGNVGHRAKVHAGRPLGQKETVRLERSPLGRRRLAPRSSEMDEPEEAFAVREPDRFAARLRSEGSRGTPVTG